MRWVVGGAFWEVWMRGRDGGGSGGGSEFAFLGFGGKAEGGETHCLGEGRGGRGGHFF